MNESAENLTFLTHVNMFLDLSENLRLGSHEIFKYIHVISPVHVRIDRPAKRRYQLLCIFNNINPPS